MTTAPYELAIEIEGEVDALATVQRVRNALAKRGPLHARIAGNVEKFTADYVFKISAYRHKSAERLGAKPTGFLERAARSIESSHDDEGATLSFPRNSGLGRAFGDVEIRPGPGKKYLTIPVNAAAYGRSAREFQDLLALRVGPRNTLILARRIKGKKILETLYVLVKGVTIKQDRKLLPSDEAWFELLKRVAIAYVEEIAARRDAV